MRPVWDLPLDPGGIEVELDNGMHVRIRPGSPDDRDAMLKAFDRMSQRSRYLRFFGSMPQMSDNVASALADVDDRHQLAWVVADPAQPSEVGDPAGLAIASARLFIDDDAAGSAEATLAIVDDYQGRGLGRFLIELLIGTAHQYSIAAIRFDVLAENRAMRALLKKLGASGAALPEDRRILRYVLAIPEDTAADPTVGALYVLLRKAAEVHHDVGDPPAVDIKEQPDPAAPA